MNELFAKLFKFFSIEGLEEKTLVKGSSNSFLIKIMGSGLAFAINIFLARILGVDDYGAYIYVFSWVSILMIPIPLGFDNSLLRFIPQYKNNEDWGSLKGIIYFSFKSVLSISFIIVVLIGVGVIYSNGFSWGYSDELILVGAIMLPFLGLMTITLKSLRGFKKVASALIPQMIIVPVITALCVLGYYLVGESVNAVEAMTAKLIGIGIALIIGLVFLKNEIPDQLKTKTPKKKYKYWLSVSLPMLLIAGIYIILNKTDVIMIGLLLSQEEVGIYGAVVKLSALTLFGLQAINIIAAPLISELYHAEKKEKLQDMITLATRISFFFSLGISVLFIFFGNYFLMLFGSAFTVGYTALIILLVAQLVNSFSGTTGYVMLMTGNQNAAAIILGLSAILNLVLSFVLIPQYGIEGGAIATGISMILWNLLMIVYINKKLGINSTIF